SASRNHDEQDHDEAPHPHGLHSATADGGAKGHGGRRREAQCLAFVGCTPRAPHHPCDLSAGAGSGGASPDGELESYREDHADGGLTPPSARQVNALTCATALAPNASRL